MNLSQTMDPSHSITDFIQHLSSFDLLIGLRCRKKDGILQTSLSEVYVRQGNSLVQVGLIQNCSFNLDLEDQGDVFVTFSEAAKAFHPEYLENIKRVFRAIGVHVDGDEDPIGTPEPGYKSFNRYQILRGEME